MFDALDAEVLLASADTLWKQLEASQRTRGWQTNSRGAPQQAEEEEEEEEEGGGDGRFGDTALFLYMQVRGLCGCGVLTLLRLLWVGVFLLAPVGSLYYVCVCGFVLLYVCMYVMPSYVCICSHADPVCYASYTPPTHYPLYYAHTLPPNPSPTLEAIV